MLSDHPIDYCACGRLIGVKPMPPSAVASRGLTPTSRPKRDSGSDSRTDGSTVCSCYLAATSGVEFYPA